MCPLVWCILNYWVTVHNFRKLNVDMLTLAVVLISMAIAVFSREKLGYPSPSLQRVDLYTTHMCAHVHTCLHTHTLDRRLKYWVSVIRVRVTLRICIPWSLTFPGLWKLLPASAIKSDDVSCRGCYKWTYANSGGCWGKKSIAVFHFKTSRDKGLLSLTVLLTYHRTAQMSRTHDEMTIVMHHGSLVFLMDNFEIQPQSS